MKVEIRTEAAQFLVWEYINEIFVAVYRPLLMQVFHYRCPALSGSRGHATPS
jgi:hypothetical protein